MDGSEEGARWARQLLFVCVAMRGSRACCSVESGISVLVVGNRRTVSEVGEVLRSGWYNPGCSVCLPQDEVLAWGAAVLGGRVASCMGKYGAPDQNIRRAEHGGSRHMTH